MRLRLGLLFLLLVVLSVQTLAGAQSPLAAVVEITYAGVELKRVNTEVWLPLPVGAQAPFGVGDTLRTDNTGRALLTFGAAAQTLLLPLSEYQLQTFEETDQQFALKMQLLNGRSIQHLTDPALVSTYQLDLQHMTLEQPNDLFATQVQVDTTSDVIVARGEIRLNKGQDELELQAGNGLRAVETFGEVVKITPPQGFSFLSVTSDTCRGLVKATIPGETSVSVRLGPGEGYLNLGNIPNDTIVPIIGKADVGGRLLTPYLSTYGWLIPSGIVLQSCRNLPLVPAEKQVIYGVVNPASVEMDMLVPFFGTPTENSRFYSYE